MTARGQDRKRLLTRLKTVAYVIGLIAVLFALSSLLTALFGHSELLEEKDTAGALLAVMLGVVGVLLYLGRRGTNLLKGHGGSSDPAEIRRRMESEARRGEVPNFEESVKRIELKNGEQALLGFWQNEHHHEQGVLLATDHRLILAQAAGIEMRDKHAPASRIPGKTLASIPYSQITAITARYTGPLGFLARFLAYANDPDGERLLARVRVLSTEQDPFECAVSSADSRELLNLLRAKTRLPVQRSRLDRWPRSKALKAVGLEEQG